MKVTTEALRRIIREAVRAKLEEAGEAEGRATDMTAPADFIIDAFSKMMANARFFDELAGSAFESMLDALGDDVPTPDRYDDIDSFAEQIAAKCVASPKVKETFQIVANNLLESLIRPG